MYGLHKEECEMAAKPKFKVGQRVRVRLEGRNGSGHGASVGEEFVIHSIESSDAVFVGEWYLWPGEFEPIFSNGDRVRVTACNAYFAAGDELIVDHQIDSTVYARHGDYQRMPRSIETSKLEWLGAADCAERNGEQEDERDASKTVTFSGTLKDDSSEWRWDLNNFTISFPPADQPCIVALINSAGKPRPSQWPHVHASVEAATKEAERLARNNPGTEFAVYQRVAGRKAEVHVEMKEVA